VTADYLPGYISGEKLLILLACLGRGRIELPTRRFSVLLIVFSLHLTTIHKINFAHCREGFILSGCLTRRLGSVVKWSSAPQKSRQKSDHGRQLVVRKPAPRVPTGIEECHWPSSVEPNAEKGFSEECQDFYSGRGLASLALKTGRQLITVARVFIITVTLETMGTIFALWDNRNVRDPKVRDARGAYER
jgi:hypothetical protein